MPYESLPNVGQSLGQTRAAIKNNFDEIKTSFDINHIDFDATNTGKHFFIENPVQGSDQVTIAGETGIYAKADTNANSQLFFRRDISANIYKLTDTVTTAITNQFGTWTPGISTVGAFTKFFGYTKCTPGNTITITLGIPLTTLCNVQLTQSYVAVGTVGAPININSNPPSLNLITLNGGGKIESIEVKAATNVIFFYEIIGVQ